MVKMNFNKKYYPAKDEIFSIMFENHELFERLLNAVLVEAGEKPVKVYKPKCQYTLTGESARHNSIRFDVFARDRQDNLYTIDMQGNYRIKNIRNRIVYYVCKAISNEVVVDNRYEDLKNVCVTFIMSKYDKDPNPIRCYRLSDDKTMEPYTDLLTLYEVYAPQADKLSDSSELKIFLKFFTIQTEEDAKNFCDEFNGISFAKILIEAYNNALTDKTLINKVIRTSKYKHKNIDERILELSAEMEETKTKLTKELSETQGKLVKVLKETGKTVEEISVLTGLTEEKIKTYF